MSSSEIVIGESIGLSGPAATQCEKHVVGQNLYFKRLNAAGGINGRKIKLIIYDDGYEPMRALENAKKLIQKDEVFALFKFYGSATIKAALPLIEENDVPLISPSSGGEFLRKPARRNVFVLKGGYQTESERMVRFLVKKGIKKVAIFYQDDAFGTEARNDTIKEMQKHGLTPVVQLMYKRTAEEFDHEFKAVVDAKPEAVILWSLSDMGVEFAKKATENGLKSILIGNSSMSTALFASVAEGSYLTLPVPPPESTKIPIVAEYLADAKKEGAAVDPTSLQSYIDAAFLAEGLKRAGPQLTRNALRSAFEKMSNTTLGGLPINMDATDHQALSDVYLTKIEKGKYVQVD